jgi:hypothetical protein
VSANLDLVRSIYADWELGDFSSTEWAHPDIDFVIVDGPERGTWSGLGELASGWSDFLSAWQDYRVEVDEYRCLGSDGVLVLLQHVGRGKASGLESASVRTEGANVVYCRDGKVARIELYWDRDRALSELGLEK